MIFRTQVSVPPFPFSIQHGNHLLLLGSCFSDYIGECLLSEGFSVNCNPFGTLYNPASIAIAISTLMSDKVFSADDLFFYDGLFHSFLHHSSFSSADETDCLNKINQSLSDSRCFFKQSDVLFVTFGTSYVYTLAGNASVVANCHKLPAKEFEHKRLTIVAISELWNDLLMRCRQKNPAMKVVFTVSPIRHLGNGAHQNQLNKALLLLAIEKIISQNPHQCFYFPAYELLLDDLRDYRFFASDMCHPSAESVKYIWEIFSDCFFNDETKHILEEWQMLKKVINHKQNSITDTYRQLLSKTLLKLSDFSNKYPTFECQKEKALLKERIEQ